MRYRKLGKTGVDASILGFGAMRLPMLGSGNPADAFDPNVPIDETEAAKMIEHAIEHGVNYFDTAYGYHGGKSEIFLGKALKKHRSKVMIATKLPTWNVEKEADLERFFNEQLSKLGTDYIDCYLIHGLGAANWVKMKNLGTLNFFDRLRSSGQVRFVGFSFHDEIKVFKEIVDGYDWSMCLVQYNFYDQNYQAGQEGVAYAAAHGMGVVVMEPLRGGKLVDKIPPEVQAIWDSAPVKRSPVEWAMKWVWNQANVTTVLTGSSSLAQLAENARFAQEASAGCLSPEDQAVIDRARAAYRKMLKVDCTGCGYCMPCPSGVNIPHNFTLYNDSFLFKGAEFNAFFYNRLLAPDQRASNCNECHTCEEKCPQKINVPEALKEVHQKLGEPPKQS
jgi:predicted aldo/keto reductase-like oxidoreductase